MLCVVQMGLWRLRYDSRVRISLVVKISLCSVAATVMAVLLGTEHRQHPLIRFHAVVAIATGTIFVHDVLNFNGFFVEQIFEKCLTFK